MEFITLDVIGLFVFISGFIVGLGAVTVIDIHGFLARKSPYWTETTIRAHKVTKPLIWLGIFLAICGGAVLYRNEEFSGIPVYHSILALILIINGIFLSFYISPKLIKQEYEGKANLLLPQETQRQIIFSFLFSFIGWWLSLFLLVLYIS